MSDLRTLYERLVSIQDRMADQVVDLVAGDAPEIAAENLAASAREYAEARRELMRREGQPR